MEMKPANKGQEQRFKELDAKALEQDLRDEIFKKGDEGYHKLFENLYDIFYQTDADGR